MGLLDSLGNFFQGVCNAVSSVLKSSALVNTLLPILGVVLPPPIDVIAVVALAAMSVALGQKEDPEKLGWQMQEADKSPEDFDSFGEYKDYLDKEFPFDEEKFNQLSDIEKSACRYVGLAGTMAELKELKGFEVTPETFGALLSNSFAQAMGLKNNDAKVNFAENIASSMQEQGFHSLEPLDQAAKGSLDVKDRDKVIDAVQNALDKTPDKSIQDAFDAIIALGDKQ